ncbi:hypothetical protein CBS101457_001182 [Exobasidium rhododendri]|nr:hypothetical protein CBS101457_001182 [Exobasidium rhododendri]
MPAASMVPAHLELLTFLTDPNAQVRQVALSNVIGYSAKTSSQRVFLIDKHKGLDGKPLLGRNGKEVDTIEDLKSLCQDQPMTAHDAFCALINLSDSLIVARRIGDADFLKFLVRYIADPISLLADLACMLLSNLTKLESVGAILLTLRLPSRPFYSFMSSEDANAAIDAMETEVDDPEYEEKKRKAEAHNLKLKELAAKGEEDVPAMSKLLDAFEEGADVGGGKSEAATIEEMRNRAKEIQQQGEEEKAKVQVGADGRPIIKRKTNCNFLASVFANLTIIPRGREFFVTPLSASSAAASATAQAAAASSQQNGNSAPPAKEYPVARIMVFTEHPDLIRRGGVISSLKNIFFIKSAHKLLIAPPSIDTRSPHHDTHLAGALRASSRPASSIDILPYLLLPLCDGQELSKLDMEDQEMLPEECQLLDEGKKRERDPALRLMLVESLLLLCTGLYGRQCLRERGCYIVVREAHLQEKDEKIAESVLRLVNILRRDESEESINDEGEGEGVNAETVEEEPTADDEDLIIEEL